MQCRHCERRGDKKLPENMFIYVMRLYLRLYSQAAAFAGFPSLLECTGTRTSHTKSTMCLRLLGNH